MKTNKHFLSHPAPFFFEQEMYQTKVMEKLETQFFCSTTLFRKSCHDTMWKNIVEPDRPQKT